MPKDTALPITLIATIGSSPAVLTEALYELHRREIWPVERIVIITTEHGRCAMEEQLFAWPNGGYYRWCSDTGLPPHTIYIDNKWIIPNDNNGRPLRDIRTRNDDQRFAEAVQQTVRKYCQDEEQRVFGLLSGGRKTMGAHLVSAMQLFARAQDQLFHVLVSEPFDTLPNFFYPTPEPDKLKDQSGHLHDASTAEVTLIDIPFLRLRRHLSQTALNFNQSYPHLLQQISQHLRVAVEKPIRSLSIDLSGRKIYLNGLSSHHSFSLPPRPLAFLAYMAATSLLHREITAISFAELLQPPANWEIHLLYYAINRTEAEKDIWLRDDTHRGMSKTKSVLKKKIKEKLEQFDWKPRPRLQHLFEFTENTRYADQAEHRLLIPPENLAILYSGDTKKLNHYVDLCRELSLKKEKLPAMSKKTCQLLYRLIELFQAPS
jgi:CRISPR-associated protein (TIGR02584 family)